MTAQTELNIQVDTQPSEERLTTLGVKSWPIWTKEASQFPWYYEEKETCYLLAGKVTVATEDQTVVFGKGDLVTFPAGLSCTWKIHEDVRKHYQFGD